MARTWYGTTAKDTPEIRSKFQQNKDDSAQIYNYSSLNKVRSNLNRPIDF